MAEEFTKEMLEKPFKVVNKNHKKRAMLETQIAQAESEEGYLYIIPLRAAGVGIAGPPGWRLRKPSWERIIKEYVSDNRCDCGCHLRYQILNGVICAECGHAIEVEG